jgi:predicted RNA-binding Zn ribbon-like protein
VVAVPRVPARWLLSLVNGYGTRPRTVAGETADPYPDLASETGQPDVTQVSTVELVDVADRLWPLFAAPAADGKADVLNRLVDHCRLTPTVGDDARIRWATPLTSPTGMLTAGCVATLLDVITTGDFDTLGTCDLEDCVDVRLETSGRRRRYCSTTCLNRARVRAYRARHRG